VSTRLGRYIVQELFGWRSRLGAVAGTLLTIAVPAYLLAFAPPGAWARFWTLFGASNQLLAALTLLAVTVWLKRSGRRIAFTLPPMLVVLALTLWALSSIAISNLRAGSGGVALVNTIAAVTLVVLALFVALAGIAKVRARA
jgi:carbon starvation protein